MAPATILIVDGERKLRSAMNATLMSHGYAVTESRNGENALKTLRMMRPDLILLDINLPAEDGINVCRQVRRSCGIPIIVVTGRTAQHDKVLALDAGADDYVVKPFDWEELLARIRALLRRSMAAETVSPFTSGQIAVDFERREVTVQNRTVLLSPKEFHLLRYLIAQKSRAVQHRELFHALWGPNHGKQTAHLRVVIKQLRKKIEADPARPKFIQTQRSVGYRFQVPIDKPSPSLGATTSVCPRTEAIKPSLLQALSQPQPTWLPLEQTFNSLGNSPAARKRPIRRRICRSCS
jgi:two-component system, OmpR family, KDP operon response regulator KdpE